MKLTLKAIALMMALTAICFGCDFRENIIEYQTGVWDVTSLKTVTYHDGVLISDVTRTDSLETMDFRNTGQGFRTDFTARTDTFTWEHYAEQERLIIYYRVGPFTNAAILNKSENSMTLYWINENADGAVLVKTEKTATIERRR